MPSTKSLLQSNIDALNEGVEFLRLLSQPQYSLAFKPAFRSTIGEHFRHLLEHYLCFLEHLDSAVVCYDRRRREQRLETDMAFAVQRIEGIQAKLKQAMSVQQSQAMRIADQQSEQLIHSSLDRELLFLQSHTMHHYAIVSAIARAHGISPAQDFGVAIATRTHQSDNARSSACAQ